MIYQLLKANMKITGGSSWRPVNFEVRQSRFHLFTNSIKNEDLTPLFVPANSSFPCMELSIMIPPYGTNEKLT
jgi:hypothetical protein